MLRNMDVQGASIMAYRLFIILKQTCKQTRAGKIARGHRQACKKIVSKTVPKLQLPSLIPLQMGVRTISSFGPLDSTRIPLLPQFAVMVLVLVAVVPSCRVFCHVFMLVEGLHEEIRYELLYWPRWSNSTTVGANTFWKRRREVRCLIKWAFRRGARGLLRRRRPGCPPGALGATKKLQENSLNKAATAFRFGAG